LGIINLQGAGEIATTDARKKKKNCFIITTPQRTYYISAESQREMESWISELIAERDRVQGKGKAAEPAAAAATTTSSSSSSAVCSISFTHSESVCVCVCVCTIS
jgi:hypothetical protein